MTFNPDELLKKDTQRMARQDTLQDGVLSKMAEVEAALHDVGDKHEVLFVGDTVMNCRELAGKLNMQPGFSCHYEEFGEKVDHDTDTIVLATHDPVVANRIKEKGNGADVVIMAQDGVPTAITELFPDSTLAWNLNAAFGIITQAESAEA